MSWPVTAVPLAERANRRSRRGPAHDDDAGRLTMDASLMASSGCPARHDASP